MVLTSARLMEELHGIQLYRALYLLRLVLQNCEFFFLPPPGNRF